MRIVDTHVQLYIFIHTSSNQDLLIMNKHNSTKFIIQEVSASFEHLVFSQAHCLASFIVFRHWHSFSSLCSLLEHKPLTHDESVIIFNQKSYHTIDRATYQFYTVYIYKKVGNRTGLCFATRLTSGLPRCWRGPTFYNTYFFLVIRHRVVI